MSEAQPLLGSSADRQGINSAKSPTRAPPDENELKRELEMSEHKLSVSEVLEQFHTTIEGGLSTSAVESLRETYGENCLTPPKTVPEWVKFLRHLTGWFSILLEAGSLLSFIAYGLDSDSPENLYIGVVLAAVVLITAIFSYRQEAKSDEIMSKFKNMLPTLAKVQRNGASVKIDARQLVPGDICEIVAGDKIPADLRLIKVNGLKVDNSSLTGECEPQDRSTEMTDENPLETKNVAFYGTLATAGSATGLVIYTGDRTVIGRIAGLAASTASEDTPIHREIHRFIIIISSVAIFLGVTFFIVGMVVSGGDWIANTVFLISIIVANVPEGLLATVTVSLSLTALRMASKNVLVKHLEAVETLGSTTTIASDKTGTLTQNRMTVAHVWFDNQIFDCPTSTQTATYNERSDGFGKLLRIATICNRATFDQATLDKEVALRSTIGDASESALIKFAEPIEPIMDVRARNAMIFEIPFNSLNKWHLTVNKQDPRDKDGRLVACMKGAPERILTRCKTYLHNGEVVPIDDKFEADFKKAYETLGSMGERVLGFCHRYLDADKYPETFEFSGEDGGNFPLDGYCFVGLMALIDPPRPAVPGAVRSCQQAGIKVIMVTGDHPITAKAIARQVGIISGETAEEVAARRGIDVNDVPPGAAEAIVVHGQQLREFELEDWDRVLNYKQIVFARTSPTQKLIIVENLQRRKEIVAVTGDGVNDSPALKKADIGVAMGITGSDVSKEAADLILLDDNFSSIVKGVEEGRLIFDNLKKSIAYTLSSNIPEILPFLLYVVLEIPLPLSTVLILCVDLGTDMVPAISLAYEEAESDIMRRPPRNADTDRLVTAKLISFSYLQIGVVQALAGLYTYMVVLGDKGFPPWELVGLAGDFEDEDNDDVLGYTYEYRKRALQSAQTAYFICIIVVQWADLLICKTRKLSLFQQGMRNMQLNFGLFSETALGALLCYTPGVQDVFLTQPINLIYWLPGLPFAVLILVYDEVRKMIMRKNPGGWVERFSYY